MQFDLDAPIIPGAAAAGLHLGQSIELVLDEHVPIATQYLATGKSYTFWGVKLWADDQRISRIGLVHGYRGTLRGSTIRIGSSGALLERLGTIAFNDDHHMIIEGLP